ncbi:MAG: hypothetical protein ACYCSS_14320 [Sulfuriferula sp.]
MPNIGALLRHDKFAVLFANAEYTINQRVWVAPDQVEQYAASVRAAESRMGMSLEQLQQNPEYQRSYQYLVEHG